MYNNTFKENLTLYAKNQNEEMFTKLYEPLCHMFKWLCSRQGKYISASDFEDVQQLVMIRIIKEIKYYKPGKGMSVISFVRMIMSQELMARKLEIDIRHNSSVEHDCDKDTRTVEDGPDRVAIYKELLEDYKATIPFRYRKIINVLIKALNNKKICSLSYVDKIAYISKRAKVSSKIVIRIIKGIKDKRFYEKI
jgi:hypothetical protein